MRGWTPSTGPRSHGSPGLASSGLTAMLVHLRDSETADRVALKIEFDEHGGLVAHHPAFVARFYVNEFRRLELFHAAIGESDVDLAARHEADVCVHAQLAAHQRAHLVGPMVSGRVNQPFDASRAPASHIHLDTADFAMLI